ncbi:hypothetical protein Ctob_011409 [Chrysochromulina tobinii]|uniref:Uncharacterized protein n=1 Tax=Chrysochromulina tobinii TaxID=1460289 RepID=A0A0M0K626_9EUKA|nr:hypothetical protein Ctob_011409 [Chrysochromulina tobinii]|eukprot:KOO34037.1 hypothetical protein Ctob_011409 [Chrysochromulina sp. CCMP291]
MRLATGLALEVAATRGAATSVPSPSDRRRASAIGSERERDIRGVREKKDEPLETRAELPSSIELGEGSLDVGALPPSTEPGARRAGRADRACGLIEIEIEIEISDRAYGLRAALLS